MLPRRSRLATAFAPAEGFTVNASTMALRGNAMATNFAVLPCYAVYSHVTGTAAKCHNFQRNFGMDVLRCKQYFI
jgi:hypothetical protein